MTAKRVFIVFLIFVLNVGFFVRGSLVYAQDGDSGVGDAGANGDNSFGPSDNGSGDSGSSEVGDAESDGTFSDSPDSQNDDSGESVSDGVNEAMQNESKAYQDLYSFEATTPEEQGMTQEEWDSKHNDLFDAAGAASAATQVAQGTFNESNESSLQEVTNIADASEHFSNEINGLFSSGLEAAEVEGKLERALAGIPESFDAGQRAATIGASGLDPETAGKLAQADAMTRQEGVGTQMGAYQIAYSTAGGSSVTAEQVTHAAINAISEAGGTFDVTDKYQSLSFAEAAFATGNTHGANLASIAQQLFHQIGISQNTIEAAAENKGVGDRIGGAMTVNPASAQSGPNNAVAPAEVAAPNQLQTGQTTPITPQAPNVGNTDRSNCIGGVCP